MTGYEIALWVQANWALRTLDVYIELATKWNMPMDTRVVDARNLLKEWRDEVGQP